MMDMLMGPAALLLLLFLVIVVGGVMLAVRVMGGRAARGDHPGEPGYDPEQHRPR